MRMNRSGMRLRLVASIVVTGLAITACGGDDADPADETATDAGATSPDDQSTEESSATDDETSEPMDVEPVQLTAQSYLGEGSALGSVAAFFYDEVTARTSGAVTFDTYWDGSLVEALGIRDAVADGRLDVGQATHAYNPDDFPITNVTSVPFVTDNVPAVTAALTRLYHEDDAYREEWESQGIRLVAFLGVPPSVLGMAEPVTGLDDLAGQQIRGVDRFIPALETVGANPVSLTAFEVYEALERGTITGYTGIPFDVVGALSLQEVAPHVVDMGQGVYAGAYLAMSLDSWNELDPAVQAVIDEVAAEIPGMIGGAYETGEQSSCDLFHEADGSVTVLPEAEVQSWADQMGDSILETWKSAVTATGADADAVYASYQSLVAEAEGEYAYDSGLAACAETF